MTYEELIEWLFHYTKLKPQLGFARADKSAMLWLPGAKPTKPTTVTWAMEKAALRGCTQLAFPDWFAPANQQPVEITWVGLDIDQEDNKLHLTDTMTLQKILTTRPSMIRTSCSGKGLHVIYRLDQPILTTHQLSGRSVKLIALPMKEAVEALGIHVCKADRRMFWLTGGKNAEIYQDNGAFLTPPHIIEARELKAAYERATMEVSDGIRVWAEKLKLPIRKSLPVYVGDVVLLLRGFGEKVETKSPCSGNGNVNGYVDISQHSISLWSYADGHTIWSYTDVMSLIGE